MTKIAKLVTVMLVARVIVEDTTTDEEAYDAATYDLIEQVNAHYLESLHEVKEDENSPYSEDDK